MDLRRVTSVAGAQHGSISGEQLRRTCGLSTAQIRTLRENGTLERVHPGVYALSGARRSTAFGIWAASLWVGAKGAVSHRSAAYVWRVEGLRGIEIEVSIRGGRQQAPGFILHRPRRLPEWQIEERSGLRVTSVARTLLDLCAVCRRWECNAAIDSALRKKLVALKDLRHMLEVESKPGRQGIGLFRHLLTDRDPDLQPPGSPLARAFLDHLRRRGFPTPVAEYLVRGPNGFVKRLDFAYPAHKLAFEIDGKATHLNAASFDHDRRVDAVLLGMGWRIIRVTKAALDDSDDLDTSIRTCLSTRIIPA